MACRPKLGTFNQPIEILDSDEESHTLEFSSFIDLTEDDVILPQNSPILQLPATRSKNFSAVDSHFHSRQPPELLSQQYLSAKGQIASPDFKNEAKTLVPSGSPTLQSLYPPRDVLIGQPQQLISENDAYSEHSDIMDRSVRRHLRRKRERTSDETSSSLPTNRNTTIRLPSFELANAQAQRSHDGSTSNDQTTSSSLLSDMEEVLQSVRHDMGQDHAAYVQNQLQDASKRRKELQASFPDFSDAIDPFSEMQLIDQRNSTAYDNDLINITNGGIVDADAAVSQIPERLPRYKHYVTITRSFLVPDNHKLYFEPYLGHNVDDNEVATQRWLEKLRKLYDPREDEQASRQREYVSRLIMYLPRMLEKLNLDWEDVLSYIIDTGLVAIGTSKTPLALLSVAFMNVFGTEIGDVFLEYGEYFSAVRKGRRKSDKPEEVDPVRKLLQPHLLSCPVCHVYLCGIHGVYETDDSEDDGKDKSDKADKSYADMNMTYKGMMHRQKTRSTQLGPVKDSTYKGKPCGPNCFSVNGLSRKETPKWTGDDTTYFETLFLGMQNQPRAACILAPLMGRPCYEVQKFILSRNTDTTIPMKTESRRSEKLDWYDNKRKKIRVDLDWGKKTNTHLHDKIQQPTGCEHPGISCFEAGDDCICDREGILCDKFCACPDDCYMKFTGCACPKGGSPCSQESLTCPCKLLNRECDPDLCHNCGAEQTVNPFITNLDRPPNSCCNTDIQRGKRKRLLVGESSHPGNIGFGAYTAEPVKQGEFIAEYVGEIISYAECARRSEIYDRLKVSFIFDLNYEVVIDSYRYGNVERFINHSKKQANCKPFVKLVNGEHRIGFFAMKDLDAGVELFFDYGKEFVFKQGLKEMGDLSKKTAGPEKARRTFNEKKKKMGGILKVAGNFSNEDDNMMVGDDEIMPAVVYSFPGEDEAEDGEAREPSDATRPSSRPRRNVKVPKRYTR